MTKSNLQKYDGGPQSPLPTMRIIWFKKKKKQLSASTVCLAHPQPSWPWKLCIIFAPLRVFWCKVIRMQIYERNKIWPKLNQHSVGKIINIWITEDSLSSNITIILNIKYEISYIFTCDIWMVPLCIYVYLHVYIYIYIFTSILRMFSVLILQIF